jgi:hypothetical protein
METSNANAVSERISPDILKSGLLGYIGGNSAKLLIGRPWSKGEIPVEAVKQIVEEFRQMEKGNCQGLISPNTTLLQTSEMSAGISRMYA